MSAPRWSPIRRFDVTPAGGRLFGEMVRRRLRREPVAYILGRKGFRHIELAVDRRVLIPRPETELLVELALEVGPRRLLDVGTGSGAIALAVADELEDCEVTATDTSAGALALARANAERLGLAERVRFLEGTIPEAGTGADGSGPAFDLILANLPYVAERDWPSLQPEVTQWEPREALLAGPDGLDAIPQPSPAEFAFCRPCRNKTRTRRRWWRWRWGRGRRVRSPRCCGRPASRRPRRGGTWPGSSGSWSGRR